MPPVAAEQPPQHRAQHAGHDDDDEDRHRIGEIDQIGSLPMLGFRRRQLLSIDQADHPVDAGRDATGEIAGLEFRRDVLIDDAVGNDIAQHALEPVADLDAQMPVILGDDEQRAIVDLLAPDLPGLGNADRELLDGFLARGRHDQDRDLAALARFQILQPIIQRGDVGCRQRSGLVDDAPGERRHRDLGPCRADEAQQESEQDDACSGHRDGCPAGVTSTARAPEPD